MGVTVAGTAGASLTVLGGAATGADGKDVRGAQPVKAAAIASQYAW
jgi:hypothetical protein